MRTVYHVFYVIVSLFFASTLFSQSPQSQIVDVFYFKPFVISADETEPVSFQVRPLIPVTEVILEVFGQDRVMFDDGTNGDEVAYDGTYTVLIAPSIIALALLPSDVFRPFIGYCKLIHQGSVQAKLNVFADVRTSEIPDVPIARLSNKVQVSPYLINIETKDWMNAVDLFYLLDSLGISKSIDFFNIVRIPSEQRAFYHRVMRNDVEGIGFQIANVFNDTIVPSRYKGDNVFPISGFFDGASTHTSALIANQWAAYIGWPYSGCAHWSFSEMASNVLGYDRPGIAPCRGHSEFNFEIEFIPEDNLYKLTENQEMEKRYHPLTLYLMGLMKPDSVEPFMVFTNQTQIRNAWSGGYLDGYQAPGKVYTIEDVIDRLGVRNPPAEEAQKEFNLYTVILSRELLSRDGMAFYHYFAKRGENTTVTNTHQGFAKRIGSPFYFATGGRATSNWKIQGFDFPVIDTVLQACAGESVSLYGKTYSETGAYEVLLKNDGGVDTVVHVDLTVLPFNSDTVQMEICAYETYTFNGSDISEAGIYRDTLADQHGCDSLVVLELEVLPLAETTLEQDICAGEIVQFGEQSIETSGTYSDTLTGSNGCDSIVNLSVHVLPVPQDTIDALVCKGKAFPFSGEMLEESGIYVDTAVASNGCDSITTLDLFVDESAVGGALSFENGMEEMTICVADNTPDSLMFRTTGSSDQYAYIVTGPEEVILAVLDQPGFDFDDGVYGQVKVHGLAYQSGLMLQTGDTLGSDPVDAGCFAYADNFLVVHKDTSGAACTTSAKGLAKAGSKVKAFPNPARSFIILAIEQLEDGETVRVIEIHDGLGTCVLRDHIRLGRGQDQARIPIGHLEPGYYLLTIEGLNQVLTFVVQR